MVAVAACAITLTGAHAANASPSTDLTKKIDAASDQVEKIAESINATNISLKKTQDNQKKLQASLAPARVALANASAQVTTIAGTAYQQGPVGPASALLSGDGTNLIQKMSYLEVIQASNQRDIDTFTETTQTFTQRQAALKATQDKQAAQLNVLKAQKKAADSKLADLNEMKISAFGSAQDTPGKAQKAPALSGAAGEAVDFAYAQQGEPYKINAAGPDSWDCSGLTMMAWRAAGYSLPHNAAAQWSATAHISRGDLKAGDLVFYAGLQHVALYVGGGQIIDAPKPGGFVSVRSINLGMSIYGYGRVT
ncbi:D-gamma-glutamyl-meso-diaminopimelic acid endopeptidase [Actinoplanes sp. TBRC 11911]|nr:D-gamma-glutamyl-meso-diaminopimelic acid endopeptidase [Actinoplanes sp. TBRC 11911]